MVIRSALIHRGWCPGLGGGDHAWVPTAPVPSCPQSCPVQLFFSFFAVRPRAERSRWGPPSRPSRVKEMFSAPALKLQRIGAIPPWRRAPPSLLGPVPGADHSRAARLGLRLWPPPSIQGRGEGRKEREEKREGEGGGGPGRQGWGGCTTRALLQSPPLFL